MSFAQILRGSRAMASPKCLPESNYSTSHLRFPRLQSITSKKNSRARGDWGLKRTLPKIKTRYICVRQQDSLYKQADFQSSAKFVRLVRNWFDAGFVRDPSEVALLQELLKETGLKDTRDINKVFSPSKQSDENDNFRRYGVSGGIQYSNVPLINSRVTPNCESNCSNIRRRLTAHIISSDASTAYYGLGGLILRLPRTVVFNRNRSSPLFSQEQRISYTVYKNGRLRLVPFSGPELETHLAYPSEDSEVESFFNRDIQLVAKRDSSLDAPESYQRGIMKFFMAPSQTSNNEANSSEKDNLSNS